MTALEEVRQISEMRQRKRLIFSVDIGHDGPQSGLHARDQRNQAHVPALTTNRRAAPSCGKGRLRRGDNKVECLRQDELLDQRTLSADGGIGARSSVVGEAGAVGSPA